jgi:hypothetical protein
MLVVKNRAQIILDLQIDWVHFMPWHRNGDAKVFYLGKIHFTFLKFHEFFNYNPKVSKLAMYPL